MPTISVIVPVYNVEKYLNRCIDSILSKTFTDFELVLVDDGSPDNSGKICDEYAKKDSRVRVIHKENGGVSSARNVGLDNAVGEYIMFCDSDDFVSKKWCEVMYNAILKYPSANIVSNCEKIFDDLVQVNSYNDYEINYETKSYYWLFINGLSGYTVNKIFNKDLLRFNNIKFDENMTIAEDVKFTIEYLKLCNNIIYIGIPLYYYFQNQSSAFHKYNANLLSVHLDAFYVRVLFIGDENIGEFCDNYLNVFIGMFDNVFDERNNMSFIEKMRYNQKMIKTQEMRFCIDNCTGQKESDLFMKIIRKRNYYLLFIFQKLTKIKKSLRRGN